MDDVVLIFDRYGTQIADIRATVKRSWLLNKVGDAEFSIAYDSPYYSREDVLRFGNYVLIQHPKLPDWIGVIETPRKWGRWRVNVKCASAEQVMSYATGKDRASLSGGAGVIYADIIRLMNAYITSIVGVGEIQTENKQRTETLTNADLFSQVRGLAERSLQDFRFAPQLINGGRLIVSANWYLRSGIVLDFVLSEGKHLEFGSTTISEQDRISNYILAYGDGAADPQSKPLQIVFDETSINLYGKRMKVENYSGVSKLDTLLVNAESFRDKHKQPKKNFYLSVSDTGEAWNNLRLGNNIGVSIWSAAFGVDTRVRIMGMNYNPNAGVVDLTTEEENDA